jgi:hypothetical protein
MSRMRRFLFSILTFSILALFPRTAPCINPHATLDDLKRLDILCYVPSYLPKSFKLKSVAITYDEWSRRESSDIDGQAERPSERERTSQPGPDEGSGGRFPLYYLEYGNGHGGSFTIDSAREGIGDRNLMETEDTEETTITSPFGPLYLIYTPKGQGNAGQKKEIKANWASDSSMKEEKAADPQAHPIRGRYHGFSATGLSLHEFEKVVASLHPIGS